MALSCVGERDAKQTKIGKIILRYNVPETGDPTPNGFSQDPPGFLPSGISIPRALWDENKNEKLRNKTFTVAVYRKTYYSIEDIDRKTCSDPFTYLESITCTYKHTEKIYAGFQTLRKRFTKEKPDKIVQDYGDYCTKRIFLFLVDLGIELYKILAQDKEPTPGSIQLSSNFRDNFENPEQFASLMATYQGILNGGVADVDETTLVPPVISEVAFRDFGRLLGLMTTGEVRDVPRLDAFDSGSATFDEIVDELSASDALEDQDLVQLIDDIRNNRLEAGEVPTDATWVNEAVDAFDRREPGDWPSVRFSQEDDNES